jgi:uncharacterized protein YbaP (TraB family)
MTEERMTWTLIKRGARRGLAGLGAVALTACSTTPAPAPPAPAGPKPALWKLADADTTIYLFGTIHLLPKGFAWRTPALDRAIAASDTLVLETLIGSDPDTAAARMVELGVTKGLPPLAERVPPEKRAALEQLIASTKVPVKVLDRMETWAAALTLLAISFRNMGYDPDLGVEKGLEASYKASAKPVSGLETIEQQFGFFDQLSEEAQRTFLIGILDAPAEARAEFEAMLKAWAAGDTEEIAATFDSETALMPELREVLMRKRNAAWAEWLEKRLEEPGTVMVAVGAGHLVGRDSVQAMLKQRGLEARRVQ